MTFLVNGDTAKFGGIRCANIFRDLGSSDEILSVQQVVELYADPAETAHLSFTVCSIYGSGHKTSC